MSVPGWLLNIIVSYLSTRELIVCHKGQQSSRKSLPGGTGQGTVLGMFLFLVLISKAGFPISESESYIGRHNTAKAKPKTYENYAL